jgi:hypothetical protein
MCGALRSGAEVRFGVEHPEYRASAVLSPEARAALAADLS